MFHVQGEPTMNVVIDRYDCTASYVAAQHRNKKTSSGRMRSQSLVSETALVGACQCQVIRPLPGQAWVLRYSTPPARPSPRDAPSPAAPPRDTTCKARTPSCLRSQPLVLCYPLPTSEAGIPRNMIG